MRWLRRLIRRNMRPVHELDAIKWRQNLSIVYALVAWNALGIVAYNIYNNKNDWASYYGLKLEEEKEERPGIYWADTLEKKNVKIYRIKDFQVIDEIAYSGIKPEK